MRANFNKTPSSRTSLKIQCRYTSQLTRKKKTWQDGFVKVFPSGNSYIVQLFDANDLRDQSLEGRLMTPKEAEHFKRKALTEMTLSNHMIEFNFDSEPAPYAPPVKVAKFKPPSIISRPAPEPAREEIFEQYNSNHSSNSNYDNNRPQNRYQSKQSSHSRVKENHFFGNDNEDHDLDELWGNDSRKKHKNEIDDRALNAEVQYDNSNHYFQKPEANDSLNRRIGQRHDNNLELNEEVDHHYKEDVPPQRSRKRPNSEVAQSYDDSLSERRPQPPPDATMNNLVRGSMRRVDQSIWDD